MKKNKLDNKWFFIVNPTAGNGAVNKEWSSIKKQLIESELPFDFKVTKERREATQICMDVIKEGYRKIVAVGGDGTNNEVINGIFQQKEISSKNILYTLLPLGTGNDWVKTHQIPTVPSQWINMLKAENTRYQDIGLVTYFKNGEQQQRYFVNVAGMAYDAYICHVLENKERKISNKTLYLLMVFKCLFQYKLRKARISFDDQMIEDYFYTFNIGLCKYSGGGMQLVPHAIVDDGYFALTIARNLSKLQVILSTAKFYDGTVDRINKVTTHKTKHIKVEAIGNKPTLLEVDGEFLGETPVEFHMLEKSLKVIVPIS